MLIVWRGLPGDTSKTNTPSGELLQITSLEMLLIVQSKYIFSIVHGKVPWNFYVSHSKSFMVLLMLAVNTKYTVMFLFRREPMIVKIFAYNLYSYQTSKRK